MQGKLTFLGTGTSMGVPTLGCECRVCRSADPHNRRLRPSVAVRWACPPVDLFPTEAETLCERIVIIDTGPDFRAQALSAGIRHVDAVVYTHSHADHIFGLDDLRPLSYETAERKGKIPLYVTAETRAVMEHVFSYTFSSEAKYSNRARVKLIDLGAGACVHEVEFRAIPVLHGEMQITGYRFGNAAYLTDVSTIPEESFSLLEGVEVMVISALRHRPHPSHATLDQAVRWASRIGARETWFTHISHDLEHEAANAKLPEGMALAYDGLTIPVVLGPVKPA